MRVIGGKWERDLTSIWKAFDGVLPVCGFVRDPLVQEYRSIASCVSGISDHL